MPADKLSAFSPQTNAGYISEALPKAGLAVKHSHYAIHGLPHDPPPPLRAKRHPCGLELWHAYFCHMIIVPGVTVGTYSGRFMIAMVLLSCD